MKKITQIFSGLCLTPLLLSHVVLAQEPKALTFVPVEVFTCSYNKGKDYDDLQRVIDKWNKWADENFPVPYTAWTMTPNFFNSEQDFEVVWLGAWQNGTDMGAGLGAWNTPGGAAMNAEFEKVVDCSSHTNFGSANIKPPEANWPTESSVALFQDCKIAEGNTMADAVAANRAIAKFLDSQGSKGGSWMMLPILGAGNIEYDYKLVIGLEDYNSLGAGWQYRFNDGGQAKIMQLSAGAMTCGSPRVYTSRLVRNGGVTPN